VCYVSSVVQSLAFSPTPWVISGTASLAVSLNVSFIEAHRCCCAHQEGVLRFLPHTVSNMSK
jgi:hypothetical protein